MKTLARLAEETVGNGRRNTVRSWFFAVAISLVLMVGQAQALMFNLDGILSGVGGSTWTPGGPYGYINLDDNANSIDVTVKLYDTTKFISVVGLNYLGLNKDGWTVSGGNIGANTLTVDPDATAWYYHFDIKVADSGPFVNPLTFTLSKAGTDLDPSMFNTTALEMAPLTIYAMTRSSVGEGFAYAASTVVPEPSTILLLAAGILGIGIYSRRRATA